MLLLARGQQCALLLEVTHDPGVRVEDLLAGEAVDLGKEPTRLVHRAVDVQAVPDAGEVVVPAVAGGGVHDAGARLERHVVAEHGRRVAVDPGMPEAQVLERGTLHDRERLAQPGPFPAGDGGVLEAGGEHVDVLAALGRIEAVVELGMEGDREVGGQRPWGGRPDDRPDLPSLQRRVPGGERLVLG